MFRCGKIGIQIERFSFPGKIVEFSSRDRLLNFFINIFLKRHVFCIYREKERRQTAILEAGRLARPTDSRIKSSFTNAFMSTSGDRWIGVTVLLVLLAGAGCNRSKEASSTSSAAPTPQETRANITAQTPDSFYDPPSDFPRTPGLLLRSEPLKDVVLPA